MNKIGTNKKGTFPYLPSVETEKLVQEYMCSWMHVHMNVLCCAFWAIFFLSVSAKSNSFCNAIFSTAESISDEETELAKLVAPPTDSSHLLDTSMDQDSLYDSSMGSSSLGQSIGTGGEGMEREREGEAEVPTHDVQLERSPEKQLASELQDQAPSCKYYIYSQVL